jgi:hypothetical protein
MVSPRCLVALGLGPWAKFCRPAGLGPCAAGLYFLKRYKKGLRRFVFANYRLISDSSEISGAGRANAFSEKAM